MGEQWYDRWPFPDLRRWYWSARQFRLRRVLTLERFVMEGEQLPRFYGHAYHEVFNDTRVAYPIPLNLIVRAWKWAYYKVWGPAFKAPRWGVKLLRMAGREQGLRIEYDGKAVHSAKVFLDGKDIASSLTGVDLSFLAGEVPQVTLRYVGPVNIQALNAEYMRAVGSIVGVPADVLLMEENDGDRSD